MATYDFKLPDIGEGVVEGEIVKWLVKDGDLVAEDQPLVEVMTDKATVTIPSPKRGRVVKTHGAEGDIAKVHQALVTIELDDKAPLQRPLPKSARGQWSRRLLPEEGAMFACWRPRSPGGWRVSTGSTFKSSLGADLRVGSPRPT
jgi:pyruvate dehydrogenase E2 component (dihydrolipoamide acetyltransferase)